MEISLERDSPRVAEWKLCVGMCGDFCVFREGAGRVFFIWVGNCVVLAGSGWVGRFMDSVYGSLLRWFRRFCWLELCVHRLGGCSQMLPCRCKNALLCSGGCPFSVTVRFPCCSVCFQVYVGVLLGVVRI